MRISLLILEIFGSDEHMHHRPHLLKACASSTAPQRRSGNVADQRMPQPYPNGLSQEADTYDV